MDEPSAAPTADVNAKPNKWINLLNIYLKEMDTNYLMFNMQD